MANFNNWLQEKMQHFAFWMLGVVIATWIMFAFAALVFYCRGWK